MKLRTALVLFVTLVVTSRAGDQTAPVQPATTQKSLAATMNVYVFPTKGQAPEQQAQANQKVQQQSRQAAQATQQQMDNFKKAFSVCLEAKNYLVR